MRSVGISVAIALVSSAEAAPRAGKVVRVERKAAGYTGHPRFCSIQPSDFYGSCTGTHAPEVGDRMVAIDRSHVVGTLRVTSVQPQSDGCSHTYNWMIQTVAESGDFATARGLVLGLSDVNIDLRGGRLVDVDKTPTGHPWGTDQIFAVDNNGDGNADLEFVQFACDDFGNASTASATSYCQDVWTTQTASKSFERVRQDRFQTCYY
jgi:hypothetical protein